MVILDGDGFLEEVFCSIFGMARQRWHSEVYTNKQILVGIYLDKGRVSDTPKSAETVISETPR